MLNTLDSGTDSLRWAIDEANLNPGSDEIHFNINGGGPQTISLVAGLPTVTETVEIDGSTQPGYAGAPLIQLEPASNAVGSPLYLVGHQGSTVRGLVFSNISDFAFSFFMAAITRSRATTSAPIFQVQLLRAITAAWGSSALPTT